MSAKSEEWDQPAVVLEMDIAAAMDKLHTAAYRQIWQARRHCGPERRCNEINRDTVREGVAPRLAGCCGPWPSVDTGVRQSAAHRPERMERRYRRARARGHSTGWLFTS